MKYSIILLIIICFSFGCQTSKSISARADVGMDTYEISGFKVFTSLAGVSPKMKAKLESKNIKKAILVNGGAIDNPKSYSVDYAKIKQYLERVLPNPKSTALVVIDIEGQKMISLNRAETNKSFNQTLNYYLEILRYFKNLRPEATIGFYGFPWRNYWNRNKSWKEKNDKLLPLIEEMDAVFPSVYDFYADDIDVNKRSDEAYIRENIEESLRLAESTNKPVYPFVWHRYHNSNKKRGMTFIDDTEFQNSIKTIVSTKYKGKRVSGIIWWSSERYFYNVSPRGKKNKFSEQDFNHFFDENSSRYIDLITEGIKDGL